MHERSRTSNQQALNLLALPELAYMHVEPEPGIEPGEHLATREVCSQNYRHIERLWLVNQVFKNTMGLAPMRSCAGINVVYLTMVPSFPHLKSVFTIQKTAFGVWCPTVFMVGIGGVEPPDS